MLGGMFYKCKELSGVKIGRLFNDKINNLDSMFYGCEVLGSIDLSGCSIGVNKNVSMLDMFGECLNLEYIDMSNIELDIVESKNRVKIFKGCNKLKDVKLPNGVKVIKRIK